MRTSNGGLISLVFESQDEPRVNSIKPQGVLTPTKARLDIGMYPLDTLLEDYLHGSRLAGLYPEQTEIHFTNDKSDGVMHLLDLGPFEQNAPMRIYGVLVMPAESYQRDHGL